jgi:hypothetical protein
VLSPFFSCFFFDEIKEKEGGLVLLMLQRKKI